MSELSARVGLYVGIDQAALGDRDRLQAAAEVIPVYRLDHRTLGWHRGLAELVPELSVPTVDDALRDLGGLRSPSELDQARRFRAAWAVARVLPDADRELLAGMVVPLVGAALAEKAGSDDFDEAQARREAREMIAFLSGPGGSPGADKFSILLRDVGSRTWVSGVVAQLAGDCCLDRPVWHRSADGEVHGVAYIDASIKGFNVGPRTLADVRAAVQPPKWPACLGGFWCKMTKVTRPRTMQPGPYSYYREAVGECPTLWFKPYLAFGPIDNYVDANNAPNGFEFHYALAPPSDLTALSDGRAHPLSQDARLTVDQGSIIFENFRAAAGGGNSVDITTSKTIGFRDFSSGGIALFACITGWADQTREMMSGCLGLP